MAVVTKQQLSPCSAASSASEFRERRKDRGPTPQLYPPHAGNGPRGARAAGQSGEQAHPAVCGAEDAPRGAAAAQPLLQEETTALKVMRMENQLMHCA